MCNGSQCAPGTTNIIDRSGRHKLSIGTSDFTTLVNRFVYVDKSMVIDDIVNQQGVTLFCRPRRFGKSCVMDMIKCYL